MDWFLALGQAVGKKRRYWFGRKKAGFRSSWGLSAPSGADASVGLCLWEFRLATLPSLLFKIWDTSTLSQAVFVVTLQPEKQLLPPAEEWGRLLPAGYSSHRSLHPPEGLATAACGHSGPAAPDGHCADDLQENQIGRSGIFQRPSGGGKVVHGYAVNPGLLRPAVVLADAGGSKEVW